MWAMKRSLDGCYYSIFQVVVREYLPNWTGVRALHVTNPCAVHQMCLCVCVYVYVCVIVLVAFTVHGHDRIIDLPDSKQ